MVSMSEIHKTAAQLGQRANAEAVILFGSYARGNPNENSDVDFLIIAESSLPRFKRSPALYHWLRPHPFAMDLLVYTPQEIKKEKDSPVSFISSVLSEGKSIYARPH